MDPQIVVVGLLVDRNGFPLEIGCFEGNKAEKLTIRADNEVILPSVKPTPLSSIWNPVMAGRGGGPGKSVSANASWGDRRMRMVITPPVTSVANCSSMAWMLFVTAS